MPDISYYICSANALDLDMKTCVSAEPRVINGRAFFTIENLTPASSYSIEVESRNGVSDQDVENVAKRIAKAFESTTEGSKLIVKFASVRNNYQWSWGEGTSD